MNDILLLLIYFSASCSISMMRHRPSTRSTCRLKLRFLAIACAIGSSTSTLSITNITVDDSLGNPDSEGIQIVYQPDGAWTPGQDCIGCEAHVDSKQVFDGTWHDVSYLADNPPNSPLTASLTFDGIAIYVYCIVTRSFTNPFGNSDMTFTIDGEQVGSFTRSPNGDPTYQYNVPVYVNESLTSGRHMFTLTTGHAGSLSALTLLDYIVFSREGAPSTLSDPTPSQSTTPTDLSGKSGTSGSTNSTVVIVVSALGAAIALTLVAILVIWLSRRRKRRSSCAAKGDSAGGDVDGDSIYPEVTRTTSSYRTPLRLVFATNTSSSVNGAYTTTPFTATHPDPSGHSFSEKRRGSPRSLIPNSNGDRIPRPDVDGYLSLSASACVSSSESDRPLPPLPTHSDQASTRLPIPPTLSTLRTSISPSSFSPTSVQSGSSLSLGPILSAGGTASSQALSTGGPRTRIIGILAHHSAQVEDGGDFGNQCASNVNLKDIERFASGPSGFSTDDIILVITVHEMEMFDGRPPPSYASAIATESAADIARNHDLVQN